MKTQRTFPFPTNIFFLVMRLARARPYCGFESLNHLIFCEQKGGVGGDVFLCDYDSTPFNFTTW